MKTATVAATAPGGEGRGISPEEFCRRAREIHGADPRSELGELAFKAELEAIDALHTIYQAYEGWLREAGRVDFDDLILRVIQALRQVPEFQARCRATFRHVLGVRERPSLPDFLAYVEELIDEFGEESLPASEVDRLLEVYRRIGEEAGADGVLEERFPLLTERGALVDPQDAFYADAPWFQGRISDPRVQFLHRSLPVTVTRLPWSPTAVRAALRPR